MDGLQELSELSIEGVDVRSFAVEHASASHDADRPVDKVFTVNLCYQDNRNPNERNWSFTLGKEAEDCVDVMVAVGDELDELNYYALGCFYDVVADSCNVLRDEVLDAGRKSLAMIVKVRVDDRFVVDEERFPDDDDVIDVEEEEEVVVVNGVEEKNILSTNGGVTFINVGQISRDLDCCSICLEEFQNKENINNGKDGVAILPCSHVFHEDCLVPWIAKGKTTCPFCRFILLPH